MNTHAHKVLVLIPNAFCAFSVLHTKQPTLKHKKLYKVKIEAMKQQCSGNRLACTNA